MKRNLFAAALLAASLALTACGGTGSPATESKPQAAAPSTEKTSEAPKVKTEDMEFTNGEKKISGTWYLPGEEKESYPTIIMCHGFGGVREDNEIYAKAFAKEGYACYAFDFCGGGRGSRSDGDMSEMSVLTEKADLLAVMDGVIALDYTDDSQLFFFAQSQGGFVASLVAAENTDKIKSLIMLYPAFALQDDCWNRHGSIDNVPETESVMNNTLGAIYSLDAMSFDVYDVIGGYTGPVLILHGDQDDLVPLSYSEKALEKYQDAKLEVLNGTGHGFGGRQKDAIKIVTPWLQEHTN